MHGSICFSCICISDSDHEEDSVLNRTPVANILLELSKDNTSEDEQDKEDTAVEPTATQGRSASPALVREETPSPVLVKGETPPPSVTELHTPSPSPPYSPSEYVGPLKEDASNNDSHDIFQSPLQYIVGEDGFCLLYTSPSPRDS